MDEIYELKEMLCKELEKYGSKGDLSAGELEIVDKLAHSVKNLGKIIEMSEMDEMSEMNEYSNAYRDGMYNRGSYARNRNSYARRDSRGRYSRADGYAGYSRAASDVVDELRALMGETPDQQMKKEIQRLITKMER